MNISVAKKKSMKGKVVLELTETRRATLVQLYVNTFNVAITLAFLCLPEAIDFQKRTLYELCTLATRVEESVSNRARYTKPTGNSQCGNQGGNKLSKKFQKSRDTTELLREKLTNNERSS